jgi:hypothetical protein
MEKCVGGLCCSYFSVKVNSVVILFDWGKMRFDDLSNG